MENERLKIFPLGESAMTIEFADAISLAANKRAISLARRLTENPFDGLIEAVPAYSSTTIFYDFSIVKKNFSAFPTAFAAVRNFVEKALTELPDAENENSRLIEIPVSFAAHDALDLSFIAESKSLSEQQVIEIFTNRVYRVFMLGFLPGFAYMGEVDERIAAPRRANPRLQVPAGSVAVAGRQTGIYPFASPGGWHIIGRTDVEIFTPHSASPTLLQTGDTVKFYAQQQ